RIVGPMGHHLPTCFSASPISGPITARCWSSQRPEGILATDSIGPPDVGPPPSPPTLSCMYGPRGPFEGKRVPRALLLVAALPPEHGALMQANRPLQRQRAGHPGTGAGARPNGTLSPSGRIWTVSLRRSVDSCSRLSPFRTCGVPKVHPNSAAVLQ